MRPVIAALAFLCMTTSSVTARYLRPRASVKVDLSSYAIKLVGEMVNADSVSWELKASSPVYFLMMDSKNWAKVQSGSLSEVEVEDAYSCIEEDGCAEFAFSFHMPVNAGNFYLVAFNPNESDVTVSGMFLAVRGGGPYSPYGNTEGPSAAEWKRSPVGVDMTNHKVRRIGNAGH